MKPMTAEEFLTHLRAESERFRAVLGSADSSADVPGCPEWSAADLLWHLSEVQWFWSQIISRRPGGPEAFEHPQRPESYSDLLASFDTNSAALIDALIAADPADKAWSWAGPEHQNVAFTLRRQTHEALIHRLDAEQATGQVTPLDPQLAADGVAEVLAVMRSGAPEGCDFSGLPHYVRVDCSDVATSFWTQLGHYADAEGDHEAFLFVPEAPAVEADTVIEGTAADLDAWLWRRIDDDTIVVHGDRDLFDHFRMVVHRPIV